MNPQDSIVTRLRRAIPSSWLPFPCPLCQRPIEIPRRDFGLDLHCPHCTAWIAAPDPTVGRPAAIRDPRVLEALRFQETHGRELSELKRGILSRSNVNRHPPAPSPPEPAPSANLQAAAHAHAQLNSAAAFAPVPQPQLQPRQPRLRPSIDPSLSFRPAETLNPPANAADAIPEWDRELGHAYPVPRPGLHLSTATKVAWFISSALVMVAVALLVHRDLETRTARAQAERDRLAALAARRDAVLASQEAESNHVHAAIAVAQSAMGAATWSGALPYVRHAERVRPLMERWHATHPWTPLRITPVDKGEIQNQDTHTFFIFTALDQTGQTRVFGLEDTASGWKFDWEVFTDRADYEWLDFLENRPVTPQPLRVAMIRRTPTIGMLEAAGIDGEEAYTVMLYGPDIARGSVFAILKEDSAIATRLDEGITFDQAGKFIAEVSFLPVGPALPEKLVTIHRIIETGWTYLDADQVSSIGADQVGQAN